MVAHDAVRLVGSSPSTKVGSFSFWQGIDPGLGHMWLRNFFAGADPLSPDDLARRRIPAGVLGAGTGGGRRDQMMRRLLASHGVGCELRLLLRDAHGLWGSLGLLRAQGGRTFDDQDVRRVARLTPALLAALRGYVTAGPLTPGGPALPAGVLIVGADHVIRTSTPQARTWLELLRARQPNPDWITEPFMAGLAVKARRHARDRRTAASPLAVGPAASYGRWIAFQAEPLDDDTDDAAIVIQAASGEQLFPSFCDWYKITPRERQILTHLRDARSPKQVARSLGLSVYTVNDHLKEIRRKTGAGGRDELLAAIAG
ncbi:helix-turn-helix transcriptional regulator [Actinomadura sp. 9N215]|uniref:helix-turn-helix transcriptional regulator n=1 Tax=Actinomadura sp. 9N215 TaxID=3375150 RepID=UPI0037BE449B